VTAEAPGSEARLPLADCHVHLWGLGDSDSGIWIDRRYRFSLNFLGNGLLLGMHWRKRSGDSYDAYYLKALLAALRRSSVDRAVVQGMEGVYDRDGELDRSSIAIHIPNEYTYRVCAEHPELVPAAAISPARRDWREQLELAAANRAAYVKMNPCVGGTDPGDRTWLPFYEKMRELGLALSCHTGPERALPGGNLEFADPARLELPLSEGLTVIASHAGTDTWMDDLPFFGHMAELMGRYEKFYADTSAVAQIFRWKWVKRLAENQLVRSRLLHGSDFPVPVSTCPWGGLTPRSWWRIRRMKSAFDRDLAVKEEVGYGRESAERAARVLGITCDPAGAS
jgi:mannonate dehydratase